MVSAAEMLARSKYEKICWCQDLYLIVLTSSHLIILGNYQQQLQFADIPPTENFVPANTSENKKKANLGCTEAIPLFTDALVVS